jgi:hypothetical protein
MLLYLERRLDENPDVRKLGAIDSRPARRSFHRGIRFGRGWLLGRIAFYQIFY